MKIIGAGLPRTGTLSTKHALEQLGFGPCYHFVTQFERPQDTDVWHAAALGKAVNWKALFNGFTASVDWPQSLFYRDLVKEFPQAGVLLNVRPATAWYASMSATVYPASVAGMDAADDSVQKRAAHAIHARGWNGLFNGRFSDPDFAMHVMEQWNADVRSFVAPHRLLVFDVRDGWGPLCKFLGVSPPTAPFPHLNDVASFKRNYLPTEVP